LDSSDALICRACLRVPTYTNITKLLVKTGNFKRYTLRQHGKPRTQ